MVRGIFYKTTIKHKYAYRRIYPLEETYVNWVPSIERFEDLLNMSCHFSACSFTRINENELSKISKEDKHKAVRSYYGGCFE